MTQDVYGLARRRFEGHIKPLLDDIRASQGEDSAECFAACIVYHLRGELGWSVAYYSKADALHYWCIATDYDIDELTNEQKREFEEFWDGWRHSKSWDDALWLDEYTGDSIVELMNWHLKEMKEKSQ